MNRLLTSILNARRKKLARKLGKIYKYDKESTFARFRFRKLIRKANRLHAATNKQYFIWPIDPMNVMIVDNTWRKFYNNQVSKAKRITAMKMTEDCFYKTPIGKLN